MKYSACTYHTSFASIITTLLLRHIGSMAAHGCRSNTDTVALFAEGQTRGTEAIIRAVKVNSADAVPVFHFVIQPASLGRDPSVSDHDIEAAKVLDDLVHGLLYSIILAHFDPVRPDFDAELVGNGCSQLLCFGGRVVPESKLGGGRGRVSNVEGHGSLSTERRHFLEETYVGTCLSKASCYFVPDATGATSDNNSTSVESKLLEHTVLDGWVRGPDRCPPVCAV